MSEIERVGVSLESNLLEQFDALITSQGYGSRSEAIRDLIREKLAQKQLAQSDSQAVAGVFLVYDHHTADLSQKLMELQHSHYIHVMASTHVHLDHHNCLEVIMLHGQVSEIEKLASHLTSMKGVKLSRVNLLTANLD